MNKKILFTLFVVLMMSFSASAQIKRVAVLATVDPENDVPNVYEAMVRSNFMKVISSTPGYEGYDRVNISEILDEHEFERNGLVSNDQIRKMGEFSGADYILVSKVYMVNESEIFVEATILDVITAKSESSEHANMGTGSSDIQHGCESLANRLFGLPDPYSQEKPNASVTPTASVTQPTPQAPKPDSVVNIAAPVVETPILANNNSRRIGEVVNFPDGSRGVVFYLDENGRGLAVSLNEGEEKWDKHRRPDDIGALLNVEKGEDNFVYGEGLKNTQAIVNVLGDEGRAAYWCVLQGEGWYLPSCGELLVLMSAVKKDSPLTTTLKAYTSNEISGWYWSSTENDNDEAWNVSSRGSTSTEGKKEDVKVRAIRTFSE